MKKHLILNHKWFDLISTGKKSSEYRDYEKWYQKLKNVDVIVFHRGYTKTTITKIIQSIDIIKTPNDLYPEGGVKTLKINLL